MHCSCVYWFSALLCNIDRTYCLGVLAPYEDLAGDDCELSDNDEGPSMRLSGCISVSACIEKRRLSAMEVILDDCVV